MNKQRKVTGSRQVTYITYDDGSQSELVRQTVEGFNSAKELLDDVFAKMSEGTEITFLSVYKNQEGKFSGDMDLSKDV